MGIDLQVTKRVKDYIVKTGFDREYGARPLKRAVQKIVEDRVSEEVLKRKVAEGERLLLDFGEQGLFFSKVKRSKK